MGRGHSLPMVGGAEKFYGGHVSEHAAGVDSPQGGPMTW